MPIYRYKCKECEHEFEALQTMKEDPLENCAICMGSLEKCISLTSFRLLGGGWFKDGYKKN
jgi:putative FmdB family regulatory protein